MREGGCVTPLTRSAVVSLPNRFFFSSTLVFFLRRQEIAKADQAACLLFTCFVVKAELPNSNEEQDCLGN